MTRRRLVYLTIVWIGGLLSLWGQLDVDRVLKIGRNALYFDDYVVAIGYFNQVAEVRPWWAEPYFYRSVAKLSLDDYNGAAMDASAAIKRNGFMPKAYLVRGIARQNTEDWAEAEADYRRGLILAPNDEGLATNLAQLLLYRKEYVAADSAARHLLAFYPKSIMGRMIIADALIGRQDTVEGLRQIDSLLQIDSTFALGYVRQAMVAYERQDWKRGVERLNKAIAVDGRELSLHVNRGMMRYQLNDLRGAMEDYTHVIEEDPMHRVARFNRALLNAYVGNSNRAIEDFEVVIKLGPTNYHAIYNRGLLYAATGRYTKAVADFNTVLKQYPRFVVGYWARSEAKRALGDLRGADKDYWDAYDLDRKLQKQGRKAETKRVTTAQDTEVVDGEKETREDTDKNIEKYNLLVIAELTPAPKAKYERKIRGRVQDRDVAVEPRKLYVLTYFPHSDKELPQAVAYAEVLNSYNSKQVLPYRLVLTNAERALTAQEVQSLELDLTRVVPQKQKLGASDSAIRVGIARLLLSDMESARKAFGVAIEHDPDLAIAYFLRAVATQRWMEADRASESIAQSTNPEGISMRTTLYKDVIQDLNRTISLSPYFAHAYYNRAWVYQSTGEMDLALRDYGRAIELYPHLGDAYYNRALLLLAQGKPTEGISDLSRAGELGLYDAYNIIKQWRHVNRK